MARRAATCDMTVLVERINDAITAFFRHDILELDYRKDPWQLAEGVKCEEHAVECSFTTKPQAETKGWKEAKQGDESFDWGIVSGWHPMLSRVDGNTAYMVGSKQKIKTR